MHPVIRVLSSFLYFSLLETLGADIDSLDRAAHNYLYPLEIGIPLSLG